MKRELILTLALIVGSNCATRSVSQASKNANKDQSTPQAAASATPKPAEKASEAAEETKKTGEVPPEFRGVDFKNRTYTTSYTSDWRKKSTTLKNGSYEYANRKEASFGTLDLKDVYYADMNGDGKKEAIVELVQVECGASCDGGTSLFYFYAIRRGRLTLLQRISTGSVAYGCGLKSFTLGERELTIEVFRNCSYSSGSFATDDQFGKFEAHEFTRFTFHVIHGKFSLYKRDVLPNPSGSVWR